MKMNIQLFATWDDLINEYNKDKTSAETELNQLDSLKQAELDKYDANYNNQLNEYKNLVNQQKTDLDTWKETQDKLQQAQTDYNIGIINQNKQEAQKQTDAELGDAYIDYQKGLNQFGGNAEIMAANGLTGTGFSKNEQIAMNITYQNRVSTAKAALMKANTEYDNQIEQARLTNDANLAEIALQHMQQSYQIALQDFEYRQNMYNQKLSYETNLNELYYKKSSDLQSRIDNYNTQLANINKQQKEEEQWWANFYESQRQFNDELQLSKDRLKEDKRQFDATYDATYNTNFSYDNSSVGKEIESGKTYQVNTAHYKGDYNKDCLTNGELDKNKVFSNGYQPNNVNGVKLQKTGKTVAEVFGTGNTGSKGASLDNQSVWRTVTNNSIKYYIWDGSINAYIDVTSQYNAKNKSTSKKQSILETAIQGNFKTSI